MTSRMAWLALAFVASVVAVGCGPGDRDTGADQRDGVVLATAEPRPSFVLTDISGQTFDFAEKTRGSPTAGQVYPTRVDSHRVSETDVE